MATARERPREPGCDTTPEFPAAPSPGANIFPASRSASDAATSPAQWNHPRTTAVTSRPSACNCETWAARPRTDLPAPFADKAGSFQCCATDCRATASRLWAARSFPKYKSIPPGPKLPAPGSSGFPCPSSRRTGHGKGGENLLCVHQLERRTRRPQSFKVRAEVVVCDDEVSTGIVQNVTHLVGLQEIVDGNHHRAGMQDAKE